MAQTLLINREDFRPFRDIADNIDAARRLDTYIQEAQQHDIRPVLNACGKDFFYYITQNQQNTAINKLLEGGTYTDSDGDTIDFKGLKPAIVYYAYARFLSNQQVNVTRHGITAKTSQYSEPISGNTITRLIEEARSNAYAYMQEVEKFLCENETDYPLWNSGGRPPRKGITITSIG